MNAQRNVEAEATARHRDTPPTPFRLWVNANREQLKAKFHRNFGRQIHEWPDFTEAEYLKSVTV